MNSRVEIARGWDLFRLGAFAEAESLLSPLARDTEVARLHLWIALRRGDVESKRHYGEILSRCNDADLAAVGRAHENVALATLTLDRRPWLLPASRWAQAEIAYARALIAFLTDQPLNIRDELAKASPQTGEQRVRYAQLRAWSKTFGEDFVGQAHLLSHALTIALKERVDRTLVSRVAGPLAIIVREVDLGDIAAHVDSLLERVEWPIDPTIYQFYGQRAIAWRRATHGNWIQAMELLNHTLAIAPDDMRRGLVHADRARISNAIPEALAAESSSFLALECFSHVDWSKARNDEAIGIMTAMDILCSKPEQARVLFQDAANIEFSKITGASHGQRRDAFKEFGLSFLVDGVEGLGHAQAAYSLFKRMKYIHRAADCAIRAVALGGGARWRQRVERLTASYPRSLAARQYERMTSPIARVQGRRREVMNLLVATEKTRREIGVVLGMAESTVQDHIKHIYQILNIESRAQLVRVYMESAVPTRNASAGEIGDSEKEFSNIQAPVRRVVSSQGTQ